MNINSLLDHPLLDTLLKIICYLRGIDVCITGKNVLFLQIEFVLVNKPVSTNTLLKVLCNNLWSSATQDQKKTFESLTHVVNLIDEKSKRCYFCKHRMFQITFINIEYLISQIIRFLSFYLWQNKFFRFIFPLRTNISWL